MQAPFNLIRDITVNVLVPGGRRPRSRAETFHGWRRLLVHEDRVSWFAGALRNRSCSLFLQLSSVFCLNLARVNLISR